MNSKNFKAILRILFLGFVFTFTCMVWLAGRAISQEKGYPEKQITIVIGFAPGGPVDVLGRIMIEELTKELKVPIVIEYKPGAGSMIANVFVVQTKPDGYTLMHQADSSFICPPAMEKNPTYDPVNDFTPIAMTATFPSVLVANSSSKLTSFDAMIKFAKQNPGKLNCGTAGIGVSSHFVLEYLRIRGVDITHVPFKGVALAVTSLLGNHVDLAGVGLTAADPHLKSGQLRALVATSKLKEFRDIPTWAEVGFPECMLFGNWIVILAPPNLPNQIRDRLTMAFKKVIQLPSVVQSAEKAGLTSVYKGPEEVKKIIIEEYKIMKEVAKTADLVK